MRRLDWGWALAAALWISGCNFTPEPAKGMGDDAGPVASDQGAGPDPDMNAVADLGGVGGAGGGGGGAGGAGGAGGGAGGEGGAGGMGGEGGMGGGGGDLQGPGGPCVTPDWCTPDVDDYPECRSWDCAPDLLCVQPGLGGPVGFCSAGCSQDQDCQVPLAEGDAAGLPFGDAFVCIVNAIGEGRCAPGDGQRCGALDQPCADGLVCMAHPAAGADATPGGLCQPPYPDGLPVGSPCGDEVAEPCANGGCVEGRCRALCDPLAEANGCDPVDEQCAPYALGPDGPSTPPICQPASDCADPGSCPPIVCDPCDLAAEGACGAELVCGRVGFGPDRDQVSGVCVARCVENECPVGFLCEALTDADGAPIPEAFACLPEDPDATCAAPQPQP